MGIPATGNTACPPESVWLEYAAGLIPERAQKLLAHAATCTPCANALREALELLQPDAEEIPADLASSTPAWQHTLAEQLAASTSPATNKPQKLILLKPTRPARPWLFVGAAAAVLVATVFTGVALYRNAHSDTRLLALAYNHHRTLPLRIPGADPVPLASFTRGAASDLADPSELLELNLRAKQHLEQTPGSPYWHQILGEIDLLKQDGRAARDNFEFAEETDHSLPNLQPDLAAAWFEIAENSNQPEAYAEATELYSKALKDSPRDPALLLYNRAICWERLNLTENALDDLHAALAVEHSEAWRKSIQSEIARLSAHTTSTPDGTPQNDGYETTLDDATARLLPLWSDSPEARAAIQRTAALGLQNHHDRWLTDWIAAPHTPASLAADRLLAQALSAARTGDADASLANAHQAVLAYTHAHHRPGLLRAQVAEAYSLQRLGHNKDCLNEIHQVINTPTLDGYAWLRTQALIEDGNCVFSTGDIDHDQGSIDQAILLSDRAQLPLLNVRARLCNAELAHREGLNILMWVHSTQALQNCTTRNCSPAAKYPFLYLDANAAQALRLPSVAAEVMRTASRLAAQTGNATTQAYTLETLGILEGQAGEYPAATRAFDQAAAIGAPGAQRPLAEFYRADWQTDRAEMLSRQGRNREALQLLQKNGPVLLSTDFPLARIHYLNQLAGTKRSLNQIDDSIAAAFQAILEAERSLPSLRSAQDKEQWQRSNERSYVELIESLLQRGDDTGALNAWERFRRAPYGETEDGPAKPSASQNHRILVLADIDDQYIGWLADLASPHALRVVHLGPADAVSRTARTYYRLCTNPASTLADLRVLGAHLYAILIQPFADQIGPGDRVWIEADNDLAILPFPALVRPDGAWFGEKSQITLLPPWWTLHPQSSLTDPTLNRDMRLLAVSGFNKAKAADTETSELPRIFPHTHVLEGSDTPPSVLLAALEHAEIFHFTGHATSTSGSRILLDSTHDITPPLLQGVHLQSCRLGVLAACNTTATDADQIEKIPDLRNALLLSGTHTVVASNWDVDDQSTQTLMQNFYRQLALGKTPAQSLQAAQQTIRTNPNWQHPYYWAPFEVFTN